MLHVVTWLLSAGSGYPLHHGMRSPSSRTKSERMEEFKINRCCSIWTTNSSLFRLPSARFLLSRFPPHHDILALKVCVTLDYLLSLILRFFRISLSLLRACRQISISHLHLSFCSDSGLSSFLLLVFIYLPRS